MSTQTYVNLADSNESPKVRLDGGTQPRVAMDDHIVMEYAEAMEAGEEFPPVVAFFDGTDFWLADGFHRVAAAEQLGWKAFPATIHEGTQRDAILHSVGANSRHGLRRSNPDKRAAVKKLLLDEEWGQWSDREIARQCGVTHPTVADVRSELVASGKLYQMDKRKYNRDGQEIVVDTSNIGQSQAAQEEPSKPLEGSKAWQEYQASKEQPEEETEKHWVDRYRDAVYTSEKPVLWPVNESRTVWVAFDNAARDIAEIVDAQWEYLDISYPGAHTGKTAIAGIKLYAVNNPAWFHSLMEHVASDEYEFAYDPELKMVADLMRTAEYGETAKLREQHGLPADAVVRGKISAATNDDDEHLTDEELEDVTDFLEQMEAEYTDRQFFLDNILDLLDSVDEQLAAAEKTLEDPQDQVYIAYLKRSALSGLGTFRDRIKKVAARPAMLTEIATALLDAATSREVQMVLGKIGQAKLGDTDGDAALETLRIEAEAKLQMIKAAEEAA